MPSPNSSFSELLATTIQMLEGNLMDQILLKNATTATLEKKMIDGGPTIAMPIMYAANNSYKRYSGSETLDTGFNDTMSAFQYAWSQLAINVQANGREVLQNSGRSQYRDIIKSRIENAKNSFQNSFNADCLSDGALPNQIGGLQLLIASAGTGVVGGVSRATWSFAKNQFYRATTDGGAALSAANIQLYMDRLDLLVGTYGGRAKVIIADNNTYTFYSSAINAATRITDTNGKLARLGFRTLAYKDAEVVFEPQAAGMPANTMYFIDPEVLKICVHSQRNLVRLPQVRAYAQDSTIEYLAWMGQLCANNFRRLGTLNNL